jgi:hypothetical protein
MRAGTYLGGPKPPFNGATSSSAQAKSGESVLVHGAAGRAGTAVLEVAALAERCGMNFILMNFVF